MATSQARAFFYGMIACLLCLGSMAAASFIPLLYVAGNGKQSRAYDTVTDIPYRRVGLLLGTSQRTRAGKVNPYYYARTYAAADLYARGKIDSILASGDNQFVAYNEPRNMKRTLLSLGVKEEDIILDYAGFRTLDSVVRTSLVFGIQEYTVITQYPHSIRALYIAQQFGYQPIAYNVPSTKDGIRIRFHLREALARIKALIDVHLLDTQPRYLGPAT